MSRTYKKEKTPAFGAFCSFLNLKLVFRLKGFGARDFLVGVFRVACRFHPSREEEAAFLGFGVVAESVVAFSGQAFLAFGIYVAIIAGFVFAVGEEAAICRCILRNFPAHPGASVKGAKATTRNHHVELTACHVVADVRGHHDEGLAFEFFVVRFGFVLASAGKGEGEAFAAGVVVTGGCRKSVGELVAYDDGNLACAGGALSAFLTDVFVAVVVYAGLSAIGAASAGRASVGGLRAVGHAAVRRRRR